MNYRNLDALALLQRKDVYPMMALEASAISIATVDFNDLDSSPNWSN
jgi:hypothetical protein